jgi:hypothetical protein
MADNLGAAGFRFEREGVIGWCKNCRSALAPRRRRGQSVRHAPVAPQGSVVLHIAASPVTIYARVADATTTGDRSVELSNRRNFGACNEVHTEHDFTQVPRSIEIGSPASLLQALTENRPGPA